MEERISELGDVLLFQNSRQLNVSHAASTSFTSHLQWSTPRQLVSASQRESSKSVSYNSSVAGGSLRSLPRRLETLARLRSDAEGTSRRGSNHGSDALCESSRPSSARVTCQKSTSLNASKSISASVSPRSAVLESSTTSTGPRRAAVRRP